MRPAISQAGFLFPQVWPFFPDPVSRICAAFNDTTKHFGQPLPLYHLSSPGSRQYAGFYGQRDGCAESRTPRSRLAPEPFRSRQYRLPGQPRMSQDLRVITTFRGSLRHRPCGSFSAGTPSLSRLRVPSQIICRTSIAFDNGGVRNAW